MNGQPKKKLSVFLLTERDTEPTEQSGVEKFCWQTMIPLHAGGASNHLHRQAAMLLQKKAGELPYLFLERFTERKMPFCIYIVTVCGRKMAGCPEEKNSRF